MKVWRNFKLWRNLRVKLFVLFSSTNSSFFVLAIIQNLSVIGNWVIFPHFQKTNRDYMVYISKKYQFANRNRYIGFRRHVTELKSSGDLNRPSPNSWLLEEYKLQPKLSIIKFSAVLSGTSVLVNKELC